MQVAQADLMLADAFGGAVPGPLEASPHLALLARRRWRASVKRGSGGSAFQAQARGAGARAGTGVAPRGSTAGAPAAQGTRAQAPAANGSPPPPAAGV
jgi:hypothetical protein